jgi:hypothetical protein
VRQEKKDITGPDPLKEGITNLHQQPRITGHNNNPERTDILNNQKITDHQQQRDNRPPSLPRETDRLPPIKKP